MAIQVSELTFLQYLAGKFDVPAPEYLPADASRAKIREALTRWGGRGVVKPDVLAGKRGKAGAVILVHDVQEAIRKLKALAGATVNGRAARTAYLVQYVPSQMELYTAITYDSRFLSPSFTLSLRGGVDVEAIDETEKATIPIDVFKGLGAYQVSAMLERLGGPESLISLLARTFVNFWDMFITSGMQMAEVNPWRVTPAGEVFACDFKGLLDKANYKYGEIEAQLPEYSEELSELEEEMADWNALSHRGQAFVTDLGGKKILPILFGGGASTIIIETLQNCGGDPMFLSDFGGNPPYERMRGAAEICFRHRLGQASCLLILGGKANNTLIDVTFQGIADALRYYVEQHGPMKIPVVVGRGGPRMVQGFLSLRRTLDDLDMPYAMFGPDTPITLVAEYAARLVRSLIPQEGDS